MPRSCRPSSSHLLAMEVTSGGQSFLWLSIQSRSCRHELRLLQEQMASNRGSRCPSRPKSPSADGSDRPDRARGCNSRTGRRAPGHSRNADRCRSHSGRAGSGCRRWNRPAWWCAPPDSRSSTAARAKCCVSSWFCGVDERPKLSQESPKRSPSSFCTACHCWRNRRRTACPPRAAASSIGRAMLVGGADAPACRYPRARQKRAKTSAGSIEPTRLPRCLTPLM